MHKREGRGKGGIVVGKTALAVILLWTGSGASARRS